MASQVDPVSKALLDLYEVHAGRRQAELDLDRARFKEQMAGRTAIPGVLAQLAQKADKEAKAREKAKAEGRAAPSAMLPPSIDVTGQTGGRDAAEGLKSAGEILATTSGGGGLRRAGAVPQGPGQTGGQFTPTGPGKAPAGAIFGAGTAAGQPAPAGGPAGTPPPGGTVVPTPQGQPQAPPQGGALQMGQGQPGEVVPLTRNLTTVERLFGQHTLAERIEGREVVDYERLPTLEQQMAPLAKPLAIYQARLTSTDPVIAADAAQQYSGALARIRTEFGDEAATVVQQQAAALRLEADEAERIKGLDPVVKRNRDIAGLESGLLEGRIKMDQLTPEQQFILKMRSKGVSVTAQILSPASKSELEKRQFRHFDMLNRASWLESVAKEQYLQRGAELEVVALEQAEKLGTVLTDEQRTLVQGYRGFRKAVGTLTKDIVRSDAGATMSPHEVEMIVNTIPTTDMSWSGFQQSQADFRHLWALDTFRDLYMRAHGFSEDPSEAKSFAQTGRMAQEEANARIGELVDGGMDPEVAATQVEDEFSRAYGMDLKRLFASPSGM